MVEERACILSIAGFDPSGGAGILADIKTFEANNVCGMGALSALTFQNDAEFDGVKWIDGDDILKQISVLERRIEFTVIKIGLIKDLEILEKIISHLPSPISHLRIIWDPIFKASAGFEFHKKFKSESLISVLKNIFLITPNIDEAKFLAGMNDPIEASKELAKHCHVLLKGGHNEGEEAGVDYLFAQDKIEKIYPIKSNLHSKHGSGCVLSSAIASNLALGYDLITSCRNGKMYVERFLASNPSLLGMHHV